MTFNEANALLTGRCKESRKLMNNTYLKRRGHDIAVCLHSTDVITFRPDGSNYTKFWWLEWSERGDMFVTVDGKRFAFADGITISPVINSLQHTVSGEASLETIRQRWREEDREKSRVSYWLRKMNGKRDATNCSGVWCHCHRRAVIGECSLCHCVRIPSRGNRLTAQDILDESNYRVQEAKATVFGLARLAALAGRVIDADAEYEIIDPSLKCSRSLYLRYRQDGSMAKVTSTTIKDAIYEALANGFQKAYAA